jgi:hypothetical protein
MAMQKMAMKKIRLIVLTMIWNERTCCTQERGNGDHLTHHLMTTTMMMRMMGLCGQMIDMTIESTVKSVKRSHWKRLMRRSHPNPNEMVTLSLRLRLTTTKTEMMT